MSLQHFLYGDHAPTAVHRVMTGILLVAFVLAAYGQLIEFIPAASWTDGGGFFAGTLLAILWIGSKAIADEGGSQRYYASSRSSVETVFAGATRSTFYFTILWLAVVHGFAGLYTRTFGATYQETMQVQTQTAALGGSCDYQITGPGIQSGATTHLCITRYEYNSWPRQVEVTLTGKHSGFGRSVDSIRRSQPEVASL